MLTVDYGVLVFFEFFKTLGCFDGHVVLCNKNYENAPFQMLTRKSQKE